MSEQLDSASNLLSEQAHKYDIALYYTHGDEVRAKQMLSGSYNDIYAIKAKFSSSSVYGAFLIFFNHLYSKVVNGYVLVSHSFAIEDIKTNVDWRIFEKEIERYLSMGEHDDILRAQFKDGITSFFSVNIGGADQKANELKKLIENDDPISVNRIVHKCIQGRIGFQNVNVSVDYQTISSLDMELYSISSNKISEHEITKMKHEEEKKNEPVIEALSEKDEDEELKGKEIKLMMNGSLILSPIKGKDISTLVPGDRIKISIIDRSQKAMTVLKAFNAYESEGSHKPIIGRIVAVKHKMNSGYKITAVVAKGIYAKIDEEEENIKVAVERPSKSLQSEIDAADSRMSIPLIIVLVVVFLGLVAAIIAFVI